ncbi:uncharacterized protein EI97DRAFT_455915 [Westerdykella ornata]|uniref:Uncharacterized protein n=1 Tax=Westerdykella ornata TaxID=318751 RepID=A0A6A6JTY9_WESOR|nr:uncharacterized protein EI97DRAFT_455915 [Westerdykella ornata]KAF2279705.1 hypothetical protein EI97DRAFT_455915 [Westerdykella ornata]
MAEQNRNPEQRNYNDLNYPNRSGFVIPLRAPQASGEPSNSDDTTLVHFARRNRLGPLPPRIWVWTGSGVTFIDTETLCKTCANWHKAMTPDNPQLPVNWSYQKCTPWVMKLFRIWTMTGDLLLGGEILLEAGNNISEGTLPDPPRLVGWMELFILGQELGAVDLMRQSLGHLIDFFLDYSAIPSHGFVWNACGPRLGLHGHETALALLCACQYIRQAAIWPGFDDDPNQAFARTLLHALEGDRTHGGLLPHRDLSNLVIDGRTWPETFLSMLEGHVMGDINVFEELDRLWLEFNEPTVRGPTFLSPFEALERRMSRRPSGAPRNGSHEDRRRSSQDIFREEVRGRSPLQREARGGALRQVQRMTQRLVQVLELDQEPSHEQANYRTEDRGRVRANFHADVRRSPRTSTREEGRGQLRASLRADERGVPRTNTRAEDRR